MVMDIDPPRIRSRLCRGTHRGQEDASTKRCKDTSPGRTAI